VPRAVEYGRGTVKIGKMPRQRVHVEITGLLSVHAVRAVQTALAGVPAIVQAEVSMAGAILETETLPDPAVFRTQLAAALELAGVELRAMRVERAGLPLL